jgi:hypothetical protein
MFPAAEHSQTKMQGLSERVGWRSCEGAIEDKSGCERNATSSKRVHSPPQPRLQIIQADWNILRIIYSYQLRSSQSTHKLTLVEHPNLPTRRRFWHSMPIIVHQHPFILCTSPQIHAEFLGLFDAWVEVLLVPDLWAEGFVLLLKIASDSLECFVWWKGLWVDPAFQFCAWRCLDDIGWIDTEVQAKNERRRKSLEPRPKPPRRRHRIRRRDNNTRRPIPSHLLPRSRRPSSQGIPRVPTRQVALIHPELHPIAAKLARLLRGRLIGVGCCCACLVALVGEAWRVHG